MASRGRTAPSSPVTTCRAGNTAMDVMAVPSECCHERTSLIASHKSRMRQRWLKQQRTQRQASQDETGHTTGHAKFQKKPHDAATTRRCARLGSTLFRSPALALWSLLLLMLYCASATGQDATDGVADLGADSDFNKVRLHWRYPRMDGDFGGFKVTHCEDQAWGPHRCRNFVLQPNELSQTPVSGGLVEYSGLVPHLRMATNYTMSVAALTPAGDPVAPGGRAGPTDEADDGRRTTSNARGRAIPDARGTAQVFIQTKGFSARAVSCLTNSTQVEVETGPYFGGKISVEGSLDAACATHGNAKDPTTKYRLDINHALCGSKLLNESVRTYILVQENLPILTHSTRRFMVVCHYVPEAFTVSAGVSLPEEVGPASLVPVDQTINEVDPSELFDFTNDLFSSRRTDRTGKSLKLQQEDEEPGPRMWTQLVLMVILVVAAVVGLSCAFWHFGKHAGLAARLRGEPLPSEGSELEAVSSDAGSVAGESDLDEHPEDSTLRQEGPIQLRDQLSPPASPAEGPNDQQAPASQPSVMMTTTTGNSSCVSAAGSSAAEQTKTSARLTGDNIFVHDLLDTGSGGTEPRAEAGVAGQQSQSADRGPLSQSADCDTERLYANAPTGSNWEQFDEDKAQMFDCDDLNNSAVQV